MLYYDENDETIFKNIKYYYLDGYEHDFLSLHKAI